LRYRVNAPQVIAETVGGETIIVNLATGHYFNLQGTAVEIWESLTRVEPVSSIVEGLSARYDARDGEIENAVSGLLHDFEGAGLIVTAENGQAVEPAPAPTGERQPFVAPSFAAFTDMQDIILLDPVHEVDATGWPHASTGA
jgi:coenzyme PQQ synthesis protein D (PqqD)